MEASRKKSRPTEVTLKRGKTGGHIVRHSFDNSGAGMSYRPSEEHALANDAALMQHLKTHYLAPPNAADDAGATADTGPDPSASPTPPGGKTVAGVSGKAKAKPPTRSTYGAGVD